MRNKRGDAIVIGSVFVLLITLWWAFLWWAFFYVPAPGTLAPRVEMIPYMYKTGWCPGTPGASNYIVIDERGQFVLSGYCWDGPTRLLEDK